MAGREPAIKRRKRDGKTYYYCEYKGKQHGLGTDYEAAKAKFFRIAEGLPSIDVSADTVRWLFAEYLADLKARNKAANAKPCLKRASEYIDATLPAREFTRRHLAKVEQGLLADGWITAGGEKRKYSPTTIADTLATVSAAFQWAVQMDMLSVNPVAGYKKPTRQQRNRVTTPGEFQALLRNSPPTFRRILIAAAMSGCRPGELRSLIWEWVDFERGLWVLEKHKSRTKTARPKIVPLNSTLAKLTVWQNQRRKAHEHVFWNEHGKPYTKDRLSLLMRRARTNAGIQVKDGEQLVLYHQRHTFATNIVGKVSDLEAAELLGHADNRTITRYYHAQVDRLHEIRKRAGK